MEKIEYYNSVNILRLKDLFSYNLSFEISVKTGSVPHMTGPSDLFYQQENGIHVAIDPDILHFLQMPGSLTFLPEILPAPAPEMGDSCLYSFFKGFPIHIGAHQNLPANLILNYGKDQAVFIFQGIKVNHGG